MHYWNGSKQAVPVQMLKHPEQCFSVDNVDNVHIFVKVRFQ